MRTFIKIFFVIIVTVIYSTIIDVKIPPPFISTIYNIAGIMFSIGLGLIVTFNLSGVKNPGYISKLRLNIKRISRLFIFYFFIASLCFLLSNVTATNKHWNLIITSDVTLKFSLNVAYNIIILYCIIYFIINFLAVRKLSDDIFDLINKENQ